jgi:hypothetical protein
MEIRRQPHDHRERNIHNIRHTRLLSDRAQTHVHPHWPMTMPRFNGEEDSKPTQTGQ